MAKTDDEYDADEFDDVPIDVCPYCYAFPYEPHAVSCPLTDTPLFDEYGVPYDE